MHAAGVNHRDCYLVHVLCPEPVPGVAPQPVLLDLHRAQIREVVPQRWRAKDLGGLAFSAMDANLTRTDLFRFVRAYAGGSAAAALRAAPSLWRGRVPPLGPGGGAGASAASASAAEGPPVGRGSRRDAARRTTAKVNAAVFTCATKQQREEPDDAPPEAAGEARRLRRRRASAQPSHGKGKGAAMAGS